MKYLLIRKLDHLGRIVLPRTLREEQDWKEGASIVIYDDEHGNLVLRKYTTPEDVHAFAEG